MNTQPRFNQSTVIWILSGVVMFLSATMAIHPARAGPGDATLHARCVSVEAPNEQSPATPSVVPHEEPGDELLVDEDVNIVTGLYTRSYSRRQNGVVDYKTARQIIFSEYNEYWNTVLETKEFPLLYWEDANQDGEFEMWVDQ